VFNDKIVRAGLAEARLSDILTDLLGLRSPADYAYVFTMSAGAVAAKVELAREVVEAAGRLVT
jgi:hypothetical protein